MLKDLQQEYINLFLIHWPVVKNCKGDTLEPSIKVRYPVLASFTCSEFLYLGTHTETIGVQETWQAMEKLVDEGLVKSIGISNFSVKKIKVWRCSLHSPHLQLIGRVGDVKKVLLQALAWASCDVAWRVYSISVILKGVEPTCMVTGVQDMLTYARIKPAVHQIEVHPMWINQYNIDFCHKEVSSLW